MPRLIDPTSDRPLYRQIADQLRTAIREGRYAEGTPLPSETQLAEMYDVTRMTARQAVDLLKNEGPGPQRTWPRRVRPPAAHRAPPGP